MAIEIDELTGAITRYNQKTVSILTDEEQRSNVALLLRGVCSTHTP